MQGRIPVTVRAPQVAWAAQNNFGSNYHSAILRATEPN